MIAALLLACAQPSCQAVATCPGVVSCCDQAGCWYERDGDVIACDGTDCDQAAADAVDAWCPP